MPKKTKKEYFKYVPALLAWFFLIELILRAFQLYLDYFGRTNGIYFKFLDIFNFLIYEGIFSPLMTVSYISEIPTLIHKLIQGSNNQNTPLEIIILSDKIYFLSKIQYLLLVFGLFKMSILIWCFLMFSVGFTFIKANAFNPVPITWVFIFLFEIIGFYVLLKIKKYYK